jgi:anti-anti-sigma factor
METGEVRLQCALADDHIEITGEVDASTCALLDAWLSEHASDDGVVAVDLAGVTFMDSSGLRVLLAHNQQACEDGRSFEVRNPSRSVERLLEITGLGDVIQVRRD